ncbi:MAG: hypothetical protein AAGF12_16310 [Myxococcota bacterium]
MFRILFTFLLFGVTVGCNEAIPVLESAAGADPNGDDDQDTLRNRHEDADFRVDFDQDGIPDFLDSDTDDDGLSDAFEAGDDDLATPPPDSDDDGLPDFRDLDSDNNGIADAEERTGDTDNDGVFDPADLDDDGDRILDVDELGDSLPLRLDSDDDQIPDYLDRDSDGDTIDDLHEALRDSNGDGTPDRLDLDSDADGFPDRIEAGDDDLSTPPIDTDGDGSPDFRDPDSDNDGLSDALEFEQGTNPQITDSDADGVSDLVEFTAETDPNDPLSNPGQRGDFFFVVPFEERPSPTRSTLAFKSSINQADLYFLWDTTVSMTEIGVLRPQMVSLIDSLTCEEFATPCVSDAACESGQVCRPADQEAPGVSRQCIADPQVTGCIPNLWTGVGTFEGRSDSYRNLLSVQPDPALTQLATPSAPSGAGSSEALFESVACVADPTACSGAGCAAGAGGVGCPGYRETAIKILIALTDEMNECTLCTPNSAVEAGAALRSRNITFVGVDADVASEPRADLQSIATFSDSQTAGGSPLYFSGDQTAVRSAVSDAIRAIARDVPLFVTAAAVDLPDDDGDATQFIDRLEVNLRGGECTAVESRADLNGDSFDDSFPSLVPGTPVCWDLIPRSNTRVRPTTEEPLLYRARVTVFGDDAPLDSRYVFFLVPGRIALPIE